MRLEVGQQLWYVPREKRWDKARFVTVEKVGRKWAQIEFGYRVSLETLAVDGGDYSSPGQCYLSRDEYEAEEIRQKAWGYLRDSVHRMWHAPAGVPIEDIRAAATLLRIGDQATP